MKILVVADTVEERLLEEKKRLAELSDVNLIIGCGDLPPEYLSSLREKYDVPLFYILGNHDIRHASSPPVGCTLIDTSVVVFGGLRFLGLSGSRWYNGNVNQYTEGEMRAKIRKLWFTLWRHRGIDLVVTHAPPRYVNDMEDPCHRGFRTYRKLVQKYEPRYFLHGHIHQTFSSESERIAILGSTRVINCYGYYTFTVEPSEHV